LKSAGRVKWLGKRSRASLINMLFSYALQTVGFVQGFVLIPLYIHYLGVSLYGYWVATSGIVGSMSFIDLGLGQPIAQRIASSMGKGEVDEASRYFWVGVSVFAAVGASVWLLCWLAAPWLPHLLSIPSQYADEIVAAFLLSALALMLKILNDFLRAFGLAILRPTLTMAVLVIAQFSGVGLTVLLLLSGFGVLAIAASLLATEIVILAAVTGYFAWLHAQQSLLVSFPHRRHFRDILGFTHHVFFAQVGFRIAQQIDATVVTFFLGPNVAVVYAVHKKLIEFLSRLLYSIWGSVMLPLSHMAGEKGARGIDGTVRALFTALFSLAVALYASYIVLDRPFVNWWVPAAAAAPLSLVAALALARIADNAFNVTSELHMVLGEVRFMARYLGLLSLLNLALFALLPPLMGVWGVPASTIIASGSGALFFTAMARRRWGLLAVPGFRLILVLAGGLAILAVAFFIAVFVRNEPPMAQWSVAVPFGTFVAGGWIYLQWRVIRGLRNLAAMPDSAPIPR
jgi:O-antigen/teichoic acid export membrane protein